jgi:hypothetical protein
LENSQLASDNAERQFPSRRTRKPKLDPEKLLKSVICSTCGFPRLPGKCTYCVRRRQRETAIKRQKELQNVYNPQLSEVEREYKKFFETNYHGRNSLEEYKFQTLLVTLLEITRTIDIDNASVQVLPHNLPRLVRILECARKLTTEWDHSSQKQKDDFRVLLGPLIAGSFGLTI